MATASKADIIARESLGYSHVVWRGQSYFVNIAAKSSRENFRQYLEKKSGKPWGIAQNNEDCVWYRSDIYTRISGDLIVYDMKISDFEAPVNCRSYAALYIYVDFSKCKVERLSELCTGINGNKVGSTIAMFNHCKFPTGVLLDLDTKSVTNFNDMFNKSNIGECKFGPEFSTVSAEYMITMFSNCYLPSTFSLGENFYTDQVKSMSGMFAGCTIEKGFSLGPNFKLAANHTGMFNDTKFIGLNTKGLSDEEIVEMLR